MNFTTAVGNSGVIGSVIDSKATTNLVVDIMADPAFTFESNDYTEDINYGNKTGPFGSVKSKILDVINANGKTMYIKCSVTRVNKGLPNTTDKINRPYVIYATYNENNEPTVYDIYMFVRDNYHVYTDSDAEFWYKIDDNFALSCDTTSYDKDFRKIYERDYPNLVIYSFFIIL